MEMKPLRASPSDEAASAAASALPEGWLLVKELGVNNLIEELYPDERLARETAARLWCSWVLFHMPAAGASLVELAAGGLGFGHESIRRHVSFEFASVHPLSLFMQNNLNALNLESIASLEHLAPSAAACAPPALAPAAATTTAAAGGSAAAATAASSTAAAAAAALTAAGETSSSSTTTTTLSSSGDGLMEGLLEKKPVHGLGLVERSLGAGWRLRRVVLRMQSIEWHHSDADEDDPQVLLLHPTASRVRACGDPGDDVERCLTVSGLVEGDSVTLVLRTADATERDAWMRAVCQRVEALKAAAFDAAVGEVGRKLEGVRLSKGEGAMRHLSVREGVRLLAERFYSSSAVGSPATDEAFETSLSDLAQAFASCLVTRQAEARVRSGVRGAPAEDEVRSLQLFPWQSRVATATEDAMWQLARAWGGAASLSAVARFFDHALGISEPFALSPHAAAHADCGPWSTYRSCVHTAVIQRLVGLVLWVPDGLADLADELERDYATLTPATLTAATAATPTPRRRCS